MKIIAMLIVLVVNGIGLSSFVHAGHCGGSHASDTAQNESKASSGKTDAKSADESDTEGTADKTFEPIESYAIWR